MQLPSLPVFSNRISVGLFAKPIHVSGVLVNECFAKFVAIFVENLLHSFGTVQIENFICIEESVRGFFWQIDGYEYNIQLHL